MTNSDLLSIAAQYGTPTYVYDTESIRFRYEKLTGAFSSGTRFFSACEPVLNRKIFCLHPIAWICARLKKPCSWVFILTSIIFHCWSSSARATEIRIPSSFGSTRIFMPAGTIKYRRAISIPSLEFPSTSCVISSV